MRGSYAWRASVVSAASEVVVEVSATREPGPVSALARLSACGVRRRRVSRPGIEKRPFFTEERVH
jgi:hypothetical protein